MAVLELKNVSRIYQTEDGNDKYALDQVSIIFPSSGLVAVVGKSGSGKSTLLNLIGLLDKPTSGEVLFNGKPLSSLSVKEQNRYRNKEIGIIFQHYHLLEHESALFNVALPMMIDGHSEKDSYKDATLLLNGIGFPEPQHKQKCCDLSGGEKERIAILRSLINSPKILLCDEPTGALDSENSIKVMQMLKKASRKKLVILVSHNDELVRKYADRIIQIKDGGVVGNKIIVEENNGVPVTKEHRKINNKKWVDKLAVSNLKRRFKRNVISSLSLIVGLISSMLIIGFSNGSPSSIEKESLKQFDYGSLTLSKELTTKLENSGMSITQMLKPTDDELNQIKGHLDSFYIMNNYDALVPYFPTIKCGKVEFEKLYYQPIHSFCDMSVDSSLLIDGYIPKSDNLSQVVINQAAYDTIKEKGFDPLTTILTINSMSVNHYYTSNDVVNPVITDYFIYEKKVQVVGVAKELNFLSNPKIYYPYVALEDYLSEVLLDNLSNYVGKDISWVDQVYESKANSDLSSYSLRLFYKDIRNASKIETAINKVPKPFSITSNSLLVKNALSELINAASMGMDLFLIITLIGSALILGIVSFASYSEDHKISAILSCLGARKEDITNIYIIESLCIGVISLIVSFALSPLFSLLINFLIKTFLGFVGMIDIPFKSYLNVPYLLPLILLIGTLLICVLSTALPILFSKKVQLKEELMDE